MANTINKEPDSRLSVRKQDLEDAELYRLNQVINDLYSRVDATRSNGRFFGLSSFQNISTPEKDNLNDIKNTDVLNFGDIQKLFSPNAFRQSGIRANWRGSTSLPSGGSGGGGGANVGGDKIQIEYRPEIPYPNSIERILNEKLGEFVSVLDFGAIGDGVSDDGPAILKAIQEAVAAGGKAVFFPACQGSGFYNVTSTNFLIWNGDIPLILYGEGDRSLIKISSTAQTGQGRFDIRGSNILFRDLKIDGMKTTPTGLLYSAFSSDPMNSLLTENTTFWIHGPSENITFERVTITHTDGYAILVDASNGYINGAVDTNGTAVTWVSGYDFSNFAANDTIVINSVSYTISSITDATNLVLTSSAGTQTGATYVNDPYKYSHANQDIKNVRVVNCNFVNNRPNLFGNVSGIVNTSGTSVTWVSGDDFSSLSSGQSIIVNEVLYNSITKNSNTSITLPSSAGSLTGVPFSNKTNGSWTGGIFLNTYGIVSGSVYPSTVYNTLVQGCYFEGNTGNCIWSHLYGFDQLFSDLRVIGNTFIDNGLDCIQFGGITGGCAIGNRTRRTGYIPTDPTQDVSTANPTVPRWLTGLNATALDTSGICKNVAYANNTFISTNGGDIDADGFCDGQIVGNVCLTPRSYDPEYAEDSISISGPANDGVTWSYGVQPSNTYGGQWGSKNVSITGNSFINKNGGAIRLSASRNGFISGNNINHPSDASYPPVLLFNIGTGADERSYDNVVANNTIFYDPATSVASIQEWGANLSLPAFQSGDKNWIHGNQLVGNTTEFYKDPDTSSTTGISVSLTYDELQNRSDNFFQRERSVVTGLDYDYLRIYGGPSLDLIATLYDKSVQTASGYVDVSGTSVTWVSGDDFSSFSTGDSIVINSVTYASITKNSNTSITLGSSAGTLTAVPFSNPVYQQGEGMLNVTTSGSGGKGSVTTGNRTSLLVDDVVATGINGVDNFGYYFDSTYDSEKANKFPDSYGLIRYDSTAKQFELSTTTTAGVRDWVVLNPTGVTSPGGSSTNIQYNNGGNFGGSSDLTWDNTNKILLVGGTDAAIHIAASGSAPATSPSAGFGGLSYKTGSEYWYYNGTSWSSVDLSTTGSTAAGSDKYVQYNDGGTSFGADANFTWDKTSKILTITGATGTAGINTITSYIQSAEGFYTASSSTTAVNVPNGAVYAGLGFATPSTSYNAIQATSGGGFYGNSSTLTKYISLASNSSLSPTSGDSFNTKGLINYDKSSGTALFYFRDGTGTSTFTDAYLYAAGLVATGNQFNSVNVTGGVKTTLGVTVDQSLYPKGYASSASLNNPASGYGGIGYKSGASYWYWNGSSWASYDFSSAPAAGSNTQIQFCDTSGGSPALAGDADLTWNKTANTMTVNGYVQFSNAKAVRFASSDVSPSYQDVITYINNGTAGIDSLYIDNVGKYDIYIRPASGRYVFLGRGSNTVSYVSPNGALSSLNQVYLGTEAYAFKRVIAESASFPAVASSATFATNPSAGFGAIGYNTGSTYWYWNGSSWATVNLSAVNPSGSTGYIQYNNGGAFGSNVNLFWDTSNNYLSLGGTTSGLTARLYVRGGGHFWSDNSNVLVLLAKGTSGQVNNLFEAQDNSGNTLLAVSASGGLYFRTSGSPSPGAGTGLIYYDTSANKFKVSENGAAATNLITQSITSINSQAGPSISLAAGTGISVSSVSNTITFTNTGVTSITGTANQVIASGSTGSITLSLPQSIDTNANPTFSTLTATSASATAISVTGSVYAAGLTATGSATNQIQCASGGVTSKYLIGTTSFTLTGETAGNAGLSGAGQGRIYFDSSSNKFRVSQNGGAYTDLLTSGLTSINSQTGPAITIAAGTGISISSGSNVVTVSNSGVTSITGTANQVIASASTGGITLSLPQNIHTTASVQFYSILTSDAIQSNRFIGPAIYAPNAYIQGRGLVSASLSAYNSIQSDAGISAGTGSNGGFYVGGTQVVNTSAQFVGTGVNCPFYGVAAGGFNPYSGGVQYFGQNWNVVGSFTINSIAYTTLIFKGGVLVGAS